MTISQETKDSIADLVIEAAMEFWEDCPNDFCIQTVCCAGIVFGSVNRVVWSPISGFCADREYCTARFLTHYYEKRGIKEGR